MLSTRGWGTARSKRVRLLDELTSKDARLKRDAWWIAIRHPEWGTALTGILKDRLAGSLTAAEREELTGQLARFTRSGSVQEFLGQRLIDAQAPKELRLVVLRAMARSGRDLSNIWQQGLIRVLKGDQPDLIGEAVLTARALNIAKNPGALPATLLHVAQQTTLPAAVRLNALAAIPGGVREVSPEMLNLLLAQLTPEEPVSARSTAVEVLTKANLTNPQLTALAQALEKVGPLELDRLVDAFTHSSDETIGLSLVKALRTAPARTSLRADTLKPRWPSLGQPSRRKHRSFTLVSNRTSFSKKPSSRRSWLRSAQATSAGDSSSSTALALPVFRVMKSATWAATWGPI